MEDKDKIMELQDKDPAGHVIKCERCKLPLIQRLPNGIWKLKWGKQKEGEDDWVPIEMYVHGSLKFKCFRKFCAQWNTLNYLPNIDEINTVNEISGLFARIQKLMNPLNEISGLFARIQQLISNLPRTK